MAGKEFLPSGKQRKGKKGKSNIDVTQLGLKRNIFYHKGPRNSMLPAPPLFFEKVTSIKNYAVVAGALSSTNVLDPVAGPIAVNSWAARYGACFTEYRVQSVVVTVESVSNNVGSALVALDDSTTFGVVAPTFASMQGLGCMVLENGVNSNNIAYLKWVLADVGEASWAQTANSVTPVYFKIYTDIANLNTPNNNLTEYLVRVDWKIVFKGRF